MNVEFVRESLMRAFFIPSQSGGSKVDNVTETRKLASSYMNKPYRVELFEHHELLVPVEPVRATETQRYKGGKIPLLPTAFDDAAWIRAVRESPSLYRTWLSYCYNDELSESGFVRLCQHVWNTFWKESLLLGVMPTKETEARLRALVWPSIQEGKRRAKGEMKIFTDSDLAEILHIHKSVFSRAIKSHWSRMISHCLMLDYESLEKAAIRHCSRSDVSNSYTEVGPRAHL